MKLASLMEMPILDASYHKAKVEKGGSFSELDKKVILKNIDSGQYKLKLQNLPDFFLYFVDHDDLKELGKEYPEGKLDINTMKIEPIEGRMYSNIHDGESKLSSVIPLIKSRLESNPQAGHFIMADNYSAENQIAPTPWMITHRLAHSVVEIKIVKKLLISYFNKIDKINGPYQNYINYIEPYLQMKSAINRKGAIDDEIFTEIVTEIMILGKLRFDFFNFQKKFGKEATLKLHLVLDQVIDTVNEDLKKIAGNVYYI